MNNPAIIIRNANIADESFIRTLVPRLTEFGVPAHRDQQTMTAVDIKILTDILNDPGTDHEIFVAENEHAVKLGFIHVQRGSDYYNKEKHGHISDVIVAAAAEGQAVGRALLDKAEAWARENGFRWLTLSVFAQNTRAKEVYNKAGYMEDIVKYVKEIN